MKSLPIGKLWMMNLVTNFFSQMTAFGGFQSIRIKLGGAPSVVFKKASFEHRWSGGCFPGMCHIKAVVMLIPTILWAVLFEGIILISCGSGWSWLQVPLGRIFILSMHVVPVLETASWPPLTCSHTRGSGTWRLVIVMLSFTTLYYGLRPAPAKMVVVDSPALIHKISRPWFLSVVVMRIQGMSNKHEHESMLFSEWRPQPTSPGTEKGSTPSAAAIPE